MLIGFVFSCAEGEEPQIEGPVQVVFETDFPDLYGAITILVEGRNEAFTIGPGQSQFTCKDPAFEVNSGEPITFQASSVVGYKWEGAVVLGKKGCQVVGVDVETMISPLVGVAVGGSGFKHDFPFEVKAGTREGHLTTPWIYRPLIELEDFGESDFRRYVLEAAAVGKAFVLPAEPYELVEFEVRSLVSETYFFAPVDASSEGRVAMASMEAEAW